METFETIREKGWLLYEYVRGSTAQGINTPKSDVDTGGIYILPNETLLGLGENYQGQISDERGDTVWYELNKFMHMVLTSNPTVLEALFVDDEFVLYENPLMTEIKKHRNEFLTKECFKPLMGYSLEQIKKARSLNKMICMQPITEHLRPLDFCYTFNMQGSIKIEVWLASNHLQQKYCGLVNLPNMHNVYGVYYDFGAHIANEPKWENDDIFVFFAAHYAKCPWLTKLDVGLLTVAAYVKEMFPKSFDYKGIVGEEDDIHIENFVGKPKIFDLRLSPINDKDEKPICYMSYNSSGYSDHCRQYKDYNDWVAKRNPTRYESNLLKNYDSKNMGHCVRMLHCGIEIAQGKGMIVNRKTAGDRDFIMKIRNHEMEYEEIIDYVEKKREEMNEAIQSSQLPNHVDHKMIDEILLMCRQEFFGYIAKH